MSDICRYWGAVKGELNRCHAFMGALPKIDALTFRVSDSDPEVVVFEGEAGGPIWPSFESALSSAEIANCPMDVPLDCSEAYAFGERYWGAVPADLGVLFGVAFVFNDEWENYHAHDSEGNWIAMTPLAEELTSLATPTRNDATVPDFMQKLDEKLLGEIAFSFGLSSVEGLYDDYSFESTQEIIDDLDSMGETELANKVRNAL